MMMTLENLEGAVLLENNPAAIRSTHVDSRESSFRRLEITVISLLSSNPNIFATRGATWNVAHRDDITPLSLDTPGVCQKHELDKAHGEGRTTPVSGEKPDIYVRVFKLRGKTPQRGRPATAGAPSRANS